MASLTSTATSTFTALITNIPFRKDNYYYFIY